MEAGVITFLVALAALAAGAFSGYYVRQSIAKKQLNTAEGKAEKVVEEAEKKAQESVLDAKNKAVEILEEAKKKEKTREDQILRLEQRLEKREELVDSKLDELEKGKKILEQRAEEVRKIKQETEDVRKRELERLEKIAGLSKEQAKTILLQLTEEESRDVIAGKMAKLEKEGLVELEKKAKNIMTSVIQKYAGSHASEVVTTTVSIPSDEVKGRIIGREGRNIKALERMTGVEVIVDDQQIFRCFRRFNKRADGFAGSVHHRLW